MSNRANCNINAWVEASKLYANQPAVSRSRAARGAYFSIVKKRRAGLPKSGEARFALSGAGAAHVAVDERGISTGQHNHGFKYSAALREA
jgi:hypothetical protein